MAAVTVSKLYCLSFKNKQAVPIPNELIAQHEGQDFLKLRPSHWKVQHLLCGQKTPSLGTSRHLATLKRKRTEQINLALATEDEEPTNNMGISPSKADTKKTRKMKEDMVLPVEVDGTQVQMLCTHFRRDCADLHVLMEESSLGPVFQFIAAEYPSQDKKKQNNKKKIPMSEYRTVCT